MVAVKAALVEPAGIVTDDGIVTAALLLLNPIARPLAGAALVRAMLQASVPAPVIERLLHVSPFRLAAASEVAVKLTARLPDEELDPMASVPVYVPAPAAVNTRVMDAVWPGFSVSGVLTPDEENEPEEIERLEIVTGRAPTEDKMTVCVAVCPDATLPKSTDEELAVILGVAAPSWIGTVVTVWPLALAEMIAV